MKGYSKNHHAYVVDTNGLPPDKAAHELSRHVESRHDGHAATRLCFFFDTLLVENTTDIISVQKKKSRRNEHRFIYLGFTSATREAQNALLKALEEPSARTSFFLLVPAVHILLDTIISRCVRLTIDISADTEPSFMAMRFSDRLAYVQKLLEEKERIPQFFARLEQDIESLLVRGTQKETAAALAHLFTYKRMVLNQSSASKYLLEELALTVPIVQ
jgi:DNA polymerase III delta prime subunit